MLLSLSSVVAIVAIWLALEPFPHIVPLLAPKPGRPAPFTGTWALNDELGKSGIFVAKDKVISAETVFLKDNDCNTAFATDSRGRIWKLPSPHNDDQDPELVAHVGGTLLGGAFDKYDNIYVADATRGLIKVPNATSDGIDAAQIVSSLAPSLMTNAFSEDSLDRSEIRYADDIVIDPVTDFVYFTDASRIAPLVSSKRRGDTMTSFVTGHLAGEATGRVLCYVPATGQTHVLALGLRFANGIGLSRDRSHLIVAATSSYTLYKVPTLPDDATVASAPAPIHATKLERFYELNLAGFPDGLSVDENGHVWVAILGPVPPVAILSDIAPALLRHVLVRLPYSLRPGSSSLHAMFAEFSEHGELLRVLHDENKRFGLLTSAARCGKYLYSGSLHGSHTVRFLVA